MDKFFFFNMMRNIFSTFFQNGIWVVGFFYILNKTFASEKLMLVSKITTIVVLAFYFTYSVLVSI